MKTRYSAKLRFFAVLNLSACLVLLAGGHLYAVDSFDVVSLIIESPQFKGKDPLQKLQTAAELIKTKQVTPADMNFVLLDWGDQYLREPSDPLERLRRWAELINDKQLSNIRIPRDFLNRVLLAEYLMALPDYVHAVPHKRLEILSKLAEKNLVDWSVSLAYAKLYAGGIIMGAKNFQVAAPLEALTALKKLKDEGLIGWYYRIPAESVLAAEVLAGDKEYRKGSPYLQLGKLRDLERKELISLVTKKELEKLPAWRMLIGDPSFVKADLAVKKERIAKMQSDGLISAPTCSDLNGLFRPVPIASPAKARPTPLPQKISPPK